MKPYLIALAAGLLIGGIYGLLSVRSPAPPVIALVGLLGILLGEQAVPIAKRLLAERRVDISAIRHEARHHVFGRLPCAANLPQRSGRVAADGRPEATS
jgi:XapX domain-containing protein